MTLHRATDLVSVQSFGSMDPYAVVVSGTEQFKTRVAEKQHTQPAWDQSFLFNLDASKHDPTLHITCAFHRSSALLRPVAACAYNCGVVGCVMWCYLM